MIGNVIPSTADVQDVWVIINNQPGETATVFANGSFGYAINGVFQVGPNTITVIANPSDDDCEPYTKEITVYYYPPDICEAPLGNITITSPVNNMILNTQTITITGSVA